LIKLTKTSAKMRDFRLPPRRIRELRSSGLLRRE